MSRATGGALLATAALAMACYSYEPLTTPAPVPGLDIAATLTDAGSAALARSLGPTVSIVRGRYIGPPPGGDGLLLSVEAVETVRGDEIGWKGEQVVLPAADIATVAVRRLSTERSILLVGVGTAGLAALVAGFKLIGSGSSSSSGSPPPPK